MTDRLLAVLEGVCFAAAILLVAVMIASAVGGTTKGEGIGLVAGAVWGGVGLLIRRYRAQRRLRRPDL